MLKSLFLRTAAICIAAMALSLPLRAETAAVPGSPTFSKDSGPVNATCDGFDKALPAWADCVREMAGSMPQDEAFYAGYWLAKTGRYQEALQFLQGASQNDERVLTYIGFATRKLGDVDGALPYYGRALALNPGYSVARAYLGEAYLSKGAPAKAKGELAEIERRCGRSCAEYADLAHHIAAYENAAHTVTR